MLVKNALNKRLTKESCKVLTNSIKTSYKRIVINDGGSTSSKRNFGGLVIGVKEVLHRGFDLNLMGHRDADRVFISMNNLEQYLENNKEKTLDKITKKRLEEILYELLEEKYSQFLKRIETSNKIR